jgi:hypothetical protein
MIAFDAPQRVTDVMSKNGLLCQHSCLLNLHRRQQLSELSHQQPGRENTVITSTD